MLFRGAFLFVVGLVIGMASGAFKRVPNQRKTRGWIVDYEQHIKTPNDHITKTLVIAYEVDGKTYQVRTSYQSSFFDLMKTMIVCYDANDPGNAFVRTGLVLRLIIAACFVGGTAVLLHDWLNWLD